MTTQPTAPPLADRIAHAIDAIHHVAVRNPRDGGERMRRAKDVLIGIVSEVVASRESATAEIERQRARADRAERALSGAGWQDLGGQEWKPPIGKPPVFIEVLSKETADEIAYLRSKVERLKAELAKAQQQQPEQCGAWGGCTLPKGHNMGNADIPENHQQPEPVAVPSDEEIREDLSRCYQDDRCSRPVYRALLGIAQRIGVQP